MRARTGTLYPRAENYDRVLATLREVVVPAAERQPGFAGFMVMGSREELKIVGITLWSTEADMLASEEGEYLQEQISKVLPLLKLPPEFESLEVYTIS